MALVLDFCTFGAHVKSRTTLNPQVNPFAMGEFQETVSNVAAAVSWFASKPLVGVNSIITSSVRADIRATLSEVTMASDILLAVPQCPLTRLRLPDSTTAEVHFGREPYSLEVSKANTQLPALIKGLLDAKSILTQYKETVGNSYHYTIFFGVTDVETTSATKHLMDALT